MTSSAPDRLEAQADPDSDEWAGVLADLLGTAVGFDRLTGEPQWHPVGRILAAAQQHLEGGDRPVRLGMAQRVAELFGPAIAQIIEDPKEEHRRTRQRLPIHRVREIDTATMAWLARTPGRTVREKVVASGRMLAVARPLTADLHENRVVRRLARDLEPVLRAAINSAPAKGSHEANGPRIEALESLLRVVTRGMAGSPLAELPASVAPRPNNTLIAPGPYGGAWRAWCLLSRFPAPLASDDAATAVVGLAAAALLAGRSGALVVESMASSVLDRTGAPWPHGLQELADVQLLLSQPDLGLLRTTFRLAEDGAVALQLEHFTDDGQGALTAGTEACYELSSALDQATGDVTLELHGVDSDPPIEKALQLSPSLGEVRRGAVWLFDSIAALRHAGIEPLDLPGVTPEGNSIQGAALDVTSVGFQTRGACGETVVPRPLIAAPVPGPRGTTEWLTGTAALGCWFGGRVVDPISFEGLWSAIAEGGLEERERRAARAMLADAASQDRSPEDMVLLVPDGLDEVGQATLRSLLPPPWTSVWLLPRSVALALAWRDTGGAKHIRPTHSVLVIDTEGPWPSATWLVGDIEGERGDGGVAGWVWERVPAQMEVAPRTARALDSAAQAIAVALDTPPESPGARAAAALGVGRPGESIGRPWVPGVGKDTLDWRRAGGDDKQIRETRSQHLRKWLDRVLAHALSREILGETAPSHLLIHAEPTLVGQLQRHVDDQGLFESTSSLPIADAACSTGGCIFLARTTTGRPTWRDRLPDLFLVADSNTRWRVFESSAVRPGERIDFEAPDTFVLPCRADVVELRLERELAGRVEAGVVARLAPPCFPLVKDVPVRFRVDFRYARDAFQLRAVPRGEAPFKELVVEWRARQTEPLVIGEQHIRNEPPVFPEQVPWEELSEDRIDSATAAVQQVERAFRDIEDKSLRDTLRGKRQSDRSKHRIALERLSQALERLVKEYKEELLTNARTPEKPDGDLAEALNKSASIAQALTSVLSPPDAGRPRKKKRRSSKAGPPGGTQHRLPREWGKSQDPTIKKALRKARANAEEVLTRLRWLAPIELHAALRQKHGWSGPLQMETRRCMALGRLIGAASDEATESVDWLLDRLNDAIESQTLGAARPPLWAFATAIWTQERFLVGLERKRIDRLDDLLEKVLRLLEKDASEPESVEVLAEAQTAVLGLLLLRGQPDGDCYDAGGERCRSLSAASLAAVAAVRGAGHQPRRPRLQFDDADGDFSETVGASLEGLRVARIRKLEE